MRILLITQEIDENSALLGVILTWIRHLAPKVDHIAVLSLSVGQADLPANVAVYSMGKERSASRLYLLRNFYGHMWCLLRGREVDLIFVHMVPRYAILAAPLARLFGIPLVLWNAHGTVSRYLRLAHRLVAMVVTASPESFRINSPKRIVTGHGIDTDYFTAREEEHEDRRLETCSTGAGESSLAANAGEKGSAANTDDRRLETCSTEEGGEGHEATERATADPGGSLTGPAGGSVLLSVGRISRSKDYGTIIRALGLLRAQSPERDMHLRIIGTPFFDDDHAYLAELKETARDLALEDRVTFAGKVPNRLMVDEYRRCDVLINASHTGSIDKVVLEAMACERPAVTCNESFAPVLADHADLLMFAPGDPAALAARLTAVLALDVDRRRELGEALRQIVVDDHSVAGLTDRFVEVFTRLAATNPGETSQTK